MHRFSGLLFAAALGFAVPASAATIIFSGAFAPEAVGASGTGTATVTLDTILLTMDVQATWSGTGGTSTVAHIHCCTASPGIGNAGVATQTPSFVGFPVGVTSGSYSQLFDMNLAASWNPAFVTGNGGTTASAFAALLSGLQNDRAYFNVHTNTFPAGETRARLVLVPEPSTVALLGIGLGLVALTTRRR